MSVPLTEVNTMNQLLLTGSCYVAFSGIYSTANSRTFIVSITLLLTVINEERVKTPHMSFYILVYGQRYHTLCKNVRMIKLDSEQQWVYFSVTVCQLTWSLHVYTVIKAEFKLTSCIVLVCIYERCPRVI